MPNYMQYDIIIDHAAQTLIFGNFLSQPIYNFLSQPI